MERLLLDFQDLVTVLSKEISKKDFSNCFFQKIYQRDVKCIVSGEDYFES